MGFLTSTMRHLINISYLAKLLVFPRVSVLPVTGPVGWRELSGYHWLSGQFWYRLKVEIVWEWENKPPSKAKATEKKSHDTLSETQEGISHGVFKVAHSPGCFSCCGVMKTGIVDIADDALNPWQRACWRKGLVGKMTWKKRKRSATFYC